MTPRWKRWQPSEGSGFDPQHDQRSTRKGLLFLGIFLLFFFARGRTRQKCCKTYVASSQFARLHRPRHHQRARRQRRRCSAVIGDTFTRADAKARSRAPAPARAARRPRAPTASSARRGRPRTTPACLSSACALTPRTFWRCASSAAREARARGARATIWGLDHLGSLTWPQPGLARPHFCADTAVISATTTVVALTARQRALAPAHAASTKSIAAAS